MFHHVSFPINKVNESFLAQRARIRFFARVNPPVNQIIFLPREAFRASIEVAMKRCLQRVILPSVVHHLVLFVETPRAVGALIFCSNVDVVHVIEQVRLHPEALTASIARELFDLLLRV